MTQSMATRSATRMDVAQASSTASIDMRSIDVRDFRRLGFVVVENVVAPARIDRMREKVLRHILWLTRKI